MKIRSFYTLNNDIYKVSLTTEDWSQGDIQLMTKFGEPEIDLGGTFNMSPSYTLPESLARVMSDSPFVQSFDHRDDEDAETRAAFWGATLVVRIEAAVTALRDLSDTYTHEEITNV